MLAACRLRFDAVTGDGDGGAMDDSGLPDAYGPMGCNAVTRLADDFEDGVFDEHRWDSTFADPGTSYSEMNGDLVLTLAPNSASTFVGYKSSVAMDFREQRVVAAVSATPATNANMGFRIESDNADDAVVVSLEGGTLQARKTVGGAFKVLTTIPFNAAMHRFWAFSEHAGTLMWEWSQDGTTFTPFLFRNRSDRPLVHVPPAVRWDAERHRGPGDSTLRVVQCGRDAALRCLWTEQLRGHVRRRRDGE